MNRSQKLSHRLLFVLLLAALCGSLAFPGHDVPVKAAPQMQAAACSAATTIAEWTFENVATPSTGSGTFNSGSGLVPAASPYNYSGGNPGQAISFQGWPTTPPLDADHYVEFVVSTRGRNDIRLDFDYRATSTGPEFLEVHYSTDGGSSFNLLGTPVALTRNSNFHSLSFDFSSIPGLNDNTGTIFRLYGYSVATGAGSTGNLRLDNVSLCGNPIVVIDSTAPNPTNATTTVTVTWHSLVNGTYEVRLGGSDCTNGTVVDSGSYTTSPNTVNSTIDAVELADGANSVRVCVTDSSARINSAASTVTKDASVPTVTINRASGQAATTNILPINFSVQFSEAINASTFTASDITQTGTATGITWTIIDSGDHINFTVRATAITGAGTLVPTIAANAVQDLAGNGNTASTSTDNTVTYTPTAASTILINEVAWAGTLANANDEWIELYNPSATNTVNLTGWVLKSSDGSPNITLSGSLGPNEFLVFARNAGTFQTTPPVTYTVNNSINLSNNGEILTLVDSNNVTIDTANSDGGSWPAGTANVTTTNPPPYATMERVPITHQWITYAGTVAVAFDRDNNPVKGTPGRANWISTTTITTITSDAPDPSLVNQNISVQVTVMGGTTVPTGTVAVTGTNFTSCTVTLSNGSGSCSGRFTSLGSKTLTATYSGDASHPPSNDTELHSVSTTIIPTPTRIPTIPPPPPLIAINEFVPRPGHDWNNDGEVTVGDEFIEIINHGTINVNLGGYSLDDEANVGSNPYSLPSETLAPGDRIVFYGSETGLLLSDGGDGVRLLKPNGQLMDAYNYSVARYPDQSYCRLPDNGGLDDWNQFCFPTPGLQNSLSGDIGSPTSVTGEPLCPIADTLPDDFAFAECIPYGSNIWRQAFWDATGWFNEKIIPGIDSRWDVFAD